VHEFSQLNFQALKERDAALRQTTDTLQALEAQREKEKVRCLFLG
jgi:hypothetical protein